MGQGKGLWRLWVGAKRKRHKKAFTKKHDDGMEQRITRKWSHAGLNRGPYGYWPYALTN